MTDASRATARMVVIYKRPADPEAFDAHYFDVHVPLAKKLPGLLKYEVSRGPIASPVGDPDTYLVGTLYFDDLATMRAAFATPEGRACAADRKVLARNDADIQMYLFEAAAV